MGLFGKKKVEQQVELPNDVQTISVIEALLFFSSEEIRYSDLSSMTGVSVPEIKKRCQEIQKKYATPESGVSLVCNDQAALFATSQSVSPIITKIQDESDDKGLSQSSLETLAVILYRGSVTRGDVDYIRGVNSTYSLRNLQLRGLVEKIKDGSSIIYKPTTDLLAHLGITSLEEVPEFVEVRERLRQIENHVKQTDEVVPAGQTNEQV